MGEVRISGVCPEGSCGLQRSAVDARPTDTWVFPDSADRRPDKPLISPLRCAAHVTAKYPTVIRAPRRDRSRGEY